jgi:5-deoxy-5-amino-3-dehydroquinate synthase
MCTGSTRALPGGLDADQLLALMARDKKALDGLTFVLDGPNGVEVVPGVAEHTDAPRSPVWPDGRRAERTGPRIACGG